MKPDEPRTPGEETEMRLTALLMGELSSEEAMVFEAQIAADPRLAALHARLKKAVELLREASALPEQAAPPAPVQLSSERRARLLAHFQGAPGAPVSPRRIKVPRRDWSWLVPMGLAAGLIALLGGSLLLNGLSLRKTNVQPRDFAVESEVATTPAEPESHLAQQPVALGTFHDQPLAPGLATDAKPGQVEDEQHPRLLAALKGTNTYTGATTLNAGTTRMQSGATFSGTGSGTGGVVAGAQIFAGEIPTTNSSFAMAAPVTVHPTESLDALAAAKPATPAAAAAADVLQRGHDWAGARLATADSLPATTPTLRDSLIAGDGSTMDRESAAAANAFGVAPPATVTAPSSPQEHLLASTNLAQNKADPKPTNLSFSDGAATENEVQRLRKADAGQAQAPAAGAARTDDTRADFSGNFRLGADSGRLGGMVAVTGKSNGRIDELLAGNTSTDASVGLAPQPQPDGRKNMADLDAPMPTAKPMEFAKAENLEKQFENPEPELKNKKQVETRAKESAPAPLPQPEIATSTNAFSTFSLNVSDVSFRLAAASLEQGKMPEPAAIRAEEFINAFDYRDPEPAAGAPLAFASERARYPFAHNRDLLRLSVKTAAAGRQPGRALNLVLLLDNSGSMERADRVRILKEALRVLGTQLQPQDKLSVVTFARQPRLWVDGVAGDQAGDALARVAEITPQGGTNLAAALDLGYATALKHYQASGINRVVLITDGAANLGDVNPRALTQKVEAHRQQGVALDCFGIGWEGLDDTLLEALARHGDGRYGFLNSPEEAAADFAGQLAGALRVAASDVKVQVEFNPRRVSTYRQIGYAQHQLTKEQFRDNTVDAAEIGAAEAGTALYVVEVNPRGDGDLATVRVRFKVPGTGDYREHSWSVPFAATASPLDQASVTLRLAGCASAFAEWLAGSPHAAEVTPDRLLSLLNGVPASCGADPLPQKLEWMIRQAKNVSGR